MITTHILGMLAADFYFINVLFPHGNMFLSVPSLFTFILRPLMSNSKDWLGPLQEWEDKIQQNCQTGPNPIFAKPFYLQI